MVQESPVDIQDSPLGVNQRGRQRNLFEHFAIIGKRR
jgi:hypothetical protein